MTRVLLDNAQWDFGTNCFVCEPKNPGGLGIPFYVDREASRVEADFTPGPHQTSAPAFAHGGLSLALLDEGMSWAVIALAERFGVTRDLAAKFVRPVLVGQPHSVRCWVISHTGSDLEACGEIRDGRDRVCVSATGTFHALTKEQVAAAIGASSAQAERFAQG